MKFDWKTKDIRSLIFESAKINTFVGIGFRNWLEDYDDYEDEDEEEYDPQEMMDRDTAIRDRSFAFENWFGGKDRIYIPFETNFKKKDQDIPESEDKDVIDLINGFKGGGKYPESEDGYEVLDYAKGLAAPRSEPIDKFDTPDKLRSHLQGKNLPPEKIKKAISNKFGIDESKKNVYKIRGILDQIKNQDQKSLENELNNQNISQRRYQKRFKRNNQYYDDIINWFEASPSRTGSGKSKKYLIAISKKPEDIENMSTGRDWKSCMEIGKDNTSKVYCEVKDGGFIAYLIEPDDKEIKNPKARVLVRRFDSKRIGGGSKHGMSVAVVESKIYGWEVPGFAEEVEKWVESKQGEIKAGLYQLKGAEYSDTYDPDGEYISSDKIEDLWKLTDPWRPDSKYALEKIEQLDKEKSLDSESIKRLHEFLKNRKGDSVWVPSYESHLLRHPELIEVEDLTKSMVAKSKKALVRSIDKLSPEVAEQLKKNIYKEVLDGLEYPPKKDDKRMGDSPYTLLGHYNDIADQLSAFRPIPNEIVKKIYELAEKLNERPIKSQTEKSNKRKMIGGQMGQVIGSENFEGRILQSFANALVQANNPAANGFVDKYLKFRGEEGFGLGGRSMGYQSLHNNLYKLGEKGKTYLPQLQKELKQVEDKIKKIELETPGLEQAYAADANSQDVNKLLNHKPAEYKNLKKSEEEYRYAIDSIEKGSLSQKYDPF
jgi:hypothetical protein